MRINHVRTQEFFEVEYEGMDYILVEIFDFGQPTDVTLERKDGKEITAEEFNDVTTYFSEHDDKYIDEDRY